MQTLAFQKAMQRFGVIQMARTGKISLKRGASLLEEAGWTERPHAARRNRSAATVDDSSYQEAGADVYAVDSNQTGEILFLSYLASNPRYLILHHIA